MCVLLMILAALRAPSEIRGLRRSPHGQSLPQQKHLPSFCRFAKQWGTLIHELLHCAYVLHGTASPLKANRTLPLDRLHSGVPPAEMHLDSN